MTAITSIQNPRIKNVIRLRRGKYRRLQRRIVIDGVREISRGLDAGLRLVEAFFCPNLCRDDEADALVARLPDSSDEVFEVSHSVFEKLSFGERAEGVVAVAAMPERTLGDITLSESPLVVVMEKVEKPGNVGAVCRTADAIGADALVLADAIGDLYNPNAIRASLGTLLTSQVCEATTDETLTWLRERGLAIFAARVDGSVEHFQADFRGPTALVLGSEADGLTDRWTAEDIQAVRLPMLGVADSLNVSTSAAVLCYEALRQRRG